jgi:hypothetical protein
VPYVIPLSLQGVTSSFPTWKPTIEEFKSLPHLHLTNADVPYDPSDTTFAQQEHALTQEMLQSGDRIGAAPPSRQLCSVSKTLLYAKLIGTVMDGATQSINDISPTLNDSTFLDLLRSKCALKRTSTRLQFEPDILIRNWGIDRRTAKRTVDGNMVSGQCRTRHCHVVSGQTIANCDIDDSPLTVSPIRSYRIQLHSVATTLLKSLQLLTNGVVRIRWKRSRMPTRACRPFSSMKVSLTR